MSNNYLKLCVKAQNLKQIKKSPYIGALLRQLLETSILLGECNVALQSVPKSDDFEDTFTRINLEGAIRMLTQRADDITYEIKKMLD